MTQSNQQELASLIQTLINEALVKGGVISEPVEPEPEPTPAEPEFFVTVNGEVVPAGIADEDELQSVITAVAETNPNANVTIYAKVDFEDIF